ncbi:MAG: hypothetical protein KKC24_08635 [Gammaproteobacteria bacterium]|nr:hypothetical protein [Gammaproteobacteria bacterium]MBU0818903.1 hypothetical protein [Gammaproteobacteria bacterium]MBU0844307.1 hypothetical protein [Gammaproteobacteria bacterium]MBU1843538.1 hypothetical protein [Gammaproteobacteria bacterium]
MAELMVDLDNERCHVLGADDLETTHGHIEVVKKRWLWHQRPEGSAAVATEMGIHSFLQAKRNPHWAAMVAEIRSR